MHWSFGMFVVLVCLLIVISCLVVKLTFKRGMNPRDEQRMHSGGRRRLRTTRRPVATREEAAAFAKESGLPRALASTSGFSPALLVISLALALWLYWRVIITTRANFDPWLIWTFNVVFVIVALQLLLASFEGRIPGGHKHHRIAVLIPLYNEDPEVVHRMLTALVRQSTPPDEIHVVDDGSTQGSYREQREWFMRLIAGEGIYGTWQRTRNRGKRHAQAQAFQQIHDADLFVTVDSDSMLDYEAIKEISHPFKDPTIMSVAGVILATNSRVNLLARITDMIFVGQQLTDRSSMSRLGSVLVNSGGLAAYRYQILADNIETYMNENYLGRHVEFSDDSMLTLFALLNGRTVQQPTAFAFAWMPDRWSHHYRQQVRWFRGSFIRGLWRIRFLPLASWGWWRQVTGWMQLWAVSSVFIYLVILRPLTTSHGIPVEVVIVPVLIGLAQNSRYVRVWRSDMTALERYTLLLLSPLATLWTTVILRPLRIWGMLTSAKMGWNTRQQIEVTSSEGEGEETAQAAPAA